MLLSKGYDVEQTKSVEAKMDLPLSKMVENFENVEYNINKISDNDAKSIYYVEQKQIGDFAPNRDDIWRWVQILNDMYLTLTGVFGKWQRIRCSDGYPVINGSYIIARGDIIG
jgi:hypothetical protein